MTTSDSSKAQGQAPSAPAFPSVEQITAWANEFFHSAPSSSELTPAQAELAAPSAAVPAAPDAGLTGLDLGQAGLFAGAPASADLGNAQPSSPGGAPYYPNIPQPSTPSVLPIFPSISQPPAAANPLPFSTGLAQPAIPPVPPFYPAVPQPSVPYVAPIAPSVSQPAVLSGLPFASGLAQPAVPGIPPLSPAFPQPSSPMGATRVSEPCRSRRLRHWLRRRRQRGLPNPVGMLALRALGSRRYRVRLHPFQVHRSRQLRGCRGLVTRRLARQACTSSTLRMRRGRWSWMTLGWWRAILSLAAGRSES